MNEYFFHDLAIDSYGGIQKVMDKHLIDDPDPNYNVLKLNNDYLTFTDLKLNANSNSDGINNFLRKLLIIGADYFEIEIVRAAKEMGYYTIVTDNRINWDNAPAKKKADEAWNISYSDIELLAEKCRENRVEGCIAGYSEFRVKCAKTLCDKLGFPFYIP